jgi:RHS repeat-associated protein
LRLGGHRSTYGYDETFGTALANAGHLTFLNNGAALWVYFYDAMGRLGYRQYQLDGTAYAVIKGFDVRGQVRWMQDWTWPNTTQDIGTANNEWTYDGAGRLLSIPGIQSSATYNAAGQMTSVTRANGVTTNYTYQASRQWLMGMRTVNAASTQLQNLTFTRDARGRILTSTSDVAAESWTYGYDDFDRLTTATNTGSSALSQVFAYDAVGNMTSNSAVGSYTYPIPGQPRAHAVTQAGSTSYSYDADGNMITAGGTSLVYDGENRLVQDGATTFGYGPDGARLHKTSGGTTTTYVGDDWEITGGVSTYYLPGDAVMTNGVVSWLHRDQLSSVRLSTNSAGAVVQRAHYKPYGERLETIATLMTSKGYIGERNDIETGLNYLHARYYDPHLARFITADPSDPTAPGVGLNRYAYAGDSPIVNLDRSGLRGEHPEPTPTVVHKKPPPGTGGLFPHPQPPTTHKPTTTATTTTRTTTSGNIKHPPLEDLGSGKYYAALEGRSDAAFGSGQGRPGGPHSPNVSLDHAVGTLDKDIADGAWGGAIGGAVIGAAPGVVTGDPPLAIGGGIIGAGTGLVTGAIGGFAYGAVHALGQIVTDDPNFNPIDALENLGGATDSADTSGDPGATSGSESSYGGGGAPGAMGAGSDPAGPPGSF